MKKKKNPTNTRCHKTKTRVRAYRQILLLLFSELKRII